MGLRKSRVEGFGRTSVIAHQALGIDVGKPEEEGQFAMRSRRLLPSIFAAQALRADLVV